MKFPWETNFDETNGSMMEHRYSDRDRLGNEWLEKRKLADKSQYLTGGKPNPDHARLVTEAEMARLMYDMAFLVESNRILVAQMEMMGAVFQRVGILEGAYSHLKSSTDYVKDQYKELIKQRLEKLRPQPKESDNG